VGRIGVLFALYPAVWGVGQLFTGALSDRWGRKHLITTGMFTQATALAVIATADTFAVWAIGATLLGAGTSMVYPMLLAAIGDVAHPAWRGRAVGIYRVWRNLDYAVGALMGGVVADLWGLRAAVWAAAAISLVSTLIVAIRMYEPTNTPRHQRPLWKPEQTGDGCTVRRECAARRLPELRNPHPGGAA
jgi:MFS family permease